MPGILLGQEGNCSESLQELLDGVSEKVPGQALDTQLSPALTHTPAWTPPLGTSRAHTPLQVLQGHSWVFWPPQAHSRVLCSQGHPAV